MAGPATVRVITPSQFAIGKGVRRATVIQSDVEDGSFAIADPGVEANRAKLVDLAWTWLDQVHGCDVVVADVAGAGCGRAGDAVVTTLVDAVVAVQTADCVPIALIGTDDSGEVTSVAAVHAGWRGLLAGVVEQAASAVRAEGAAHVVAVVGAHIHPGCYRFEAADASPLVQRYGDALSAVTDTGEPALDMTAGVRAALRAAGVDVGYVHPSCTGCDDRFFSHRSRGDVGRQALAVWMHT